MSDSEDEVASRRVSEAMRYLSVMGEKEMDELIEEDEEGEEDEDGLPEWATVEPFGADLIARANSLLRYLLPATLVPCLPITPTRDTLLDSLSDGHLLCVAYNAGVSKCKKAWGFINAESIHETALATTAEQATGNWTFRRRENLGLWAATVTLVQTRDDLGGMRGGVLAYLREELPVGASSIPIAAYAFMSGYLNAVTFTTCAIWCGFMTGNSVMLGLALARVSLGRRREATFAMNDAQATAALICFVCGIALARVGDLSFWSGPKPISQAAAVNQDPEKASGDPELGLSHPAPEQLQLPRSSSDWADSGAPTRVGTPVPFTKGPRLIVPSTPASGPSSSLAKSPTDTLGLAPSPVANLDSPSKPETTITPAPVPASAPARTRLWLVVGTLFQALLLVGAGVAAMHDPTRRSSLAAGASTNPRVPANAPWS
ncbi:hypothetical protein FRC11_008199, partial [Ceratobasidium sp. 423]